GPPGWVAGWGAAGGRQDCRGRDVLEGPAGSWLACEPLAVGTIAAGQMCSKGPPVAGLRAAGSRHDLDVRMEFLVLAVEPGPLMSGGAVDAGPQAMRAGFHEISALFS